MRSNRMYLLHKIHLIRLVFSGLLTLLLLPTQKLLAVSLSPSAPLSDLLPQSANKIVNF